MFSPVVGGRGLVHHHAGGRHGRRHVGKLERDALEVDDRLAEGDARGGPVARRLVGSQGDPHRLGGHHHPADIQRLEGQAERAALGADQVLGRHQRVELQVAGAGAADAHLVGIVVDRHARPLLVDDEGADAAWARGRVGAGEDDVVARDAAIADPVLLAAQAPAVAFAHGRRRQRSGVGARPLLAQREADRMTTGELAQIFCLLLRRSFEQDGKAPS